MSEMRRRTRRCGALAPLALVLVASCSSGPTGEPAPPTAEPGRAAHEHEPRPARADNGDASTQVAPVAADTPKTLGETSRAELEQALGRSEPVSGLGTSRPRGSPGQGSAPGQRELQRILVVDTVTVVGAVDQKVVEKRLEDRRLIAHCYAGAAELRQLRGTMSAQFVIARDGTVSSADAKGLDARLEVCVKETMQRQTFPAPSDGKPARVIVALEMVPAI